MEGPRARAAGAMFLCALVSLTAAPDARAQVREPGNTLSAGDNSGPLSDVSRPLQESPPVHDGAQTIGEASGGSVRSGPVRDAHTRSMLSGPVSESSRGPMYEPRPPLTSGAVAEASAGAVKHDIDDPLGERISSPLRELAPLQQAMRLRREEAERAVLEGATAPVAPPLEAVPVAEEPPADAASTVEEVPGAGAAEPAPDRDTSEPDVAQQ